jgi:hypothetical protein
MGNLVLLLPLALLLLAPFKMRSSKYLTILLGVLVFTLTFFLRINHLLDPISEIKHFALAIVIFVLCGVLYAWYFERIVRNKRV